VSLQPGKTRAGEGSGGGLNEKGREKAPKHDFLNFWGGGREKKKNLVEDNDRQQSPGTLKKGGDIGGGSGGQRFQFWRRSNELSC